MDIELRIEWGRIGLLIAAVATIALAFYVTYNVGHAYGFTEGHIAGFHDGQERGIADGLTLAKSGKVKCPTHPDCWITLIPICSNPYGPLVDQETGEPVKEVFEEPNDPENCR